ncbi:MAG: 50S ribosomal protein L17 [Acidobacteria bacterium]|nr:50S ribosomal protein L17 [Acidobacteriota bacterium]
MRHRVAGKKLGRKTAHRVMMFRNMVTSLFDKERIRTTLDRAKAVRPIAERMITLGKRETLHARRQALAFVKDPAIVAKLFDTIAPRFAQRPGGYTRIIRLGFRDGDGAQMAFLELIGSEFKPTGKEEKKGGKKKSKETAAGAENKEEEKTGKKKTQKAAADTGKKEAAKPKRKKSKEASAEGEKKEQ